jgi:hypothetical protein
MTIYPCKYGHGNVGYSKGGQCVQCCRDRAAEARKRDPEAHRLRKNEWQSIKLYGLTIDGRNKLLASQGDACAICGRTGLTWGKGFNDVWHIDHEHGQEGTHRGILCAACNLALGKLEPYMDQVLAYLAKHKRNLPDGNLNSYDIADNGVGEEIIVQSSISGRK